MMQQLLQFNPEIKQALQAKQPIVAIESSFISHGMPYPENLETANLIEQVIRNAGATPAIIAIYQGKIHIGINQEIIEYFSTHHNNMIKASRRDIAFILSRKMSASTNVAASLFCAHIAGLPLLMTAAIGGVCYHSEEHLNISADLIELSNTPVAVICSGAKSILDLPQTIAVLEKHGVPVVGYQTEEFPAFYSHSSGISLFQHLTTPDEIADLVYYHHRLQSQNGIVIANPIPKTAEIPHKDLKPLIRQAQQEAEYSEGKTITPRLLNRIAELTAGQSWHAMIELLKSNARLAAEIAIAYQKLRRQL